MRKFNLFDTQISLDVWQNKYKGPDDKSLDDTFRRVANAVFPPNDRIMTTEGNLAHHLMSEGIWMPAGRILAGAGTGRRVTLMNCYVMAEMEDSLASIMATLNQSALTMQQGGGIGVHFGGLRPTGATLVRTGSYSSGPCTFIDMWDSMCATIMSAGHRRGAMMATMPISHPDVVEFIQAKSKKGRWTNFNVSVLVSDAFMKAVEKDHDWRLHHEKPHKDGGQETVQIDGQTHYVYRKMKARELWELLTKHTYEYSEPGVIFIDRINKNNNLAYLETITATNPCGEQPLPPFGACNLGAVNLARLVNVPFSAISRDVDMQRLREAVRLGVEFLDNVIDVTGYPLEQQANEQQIKRRIGLGITGLADALAMLGMHYAHPDAIAAAGRWMKAIAVFAYERSIELAQEKGTFKGFLHKEHSQAPFVQKMLAAISNEHREMYKRVGIRNGTLLTVAPTGTTSVFFGNVSSGCEPNFAHYYTRRVRQPDDTYREYPDYSHLVRRYAWEHNALPLEDALKEVQEDNALNAIASTLTITEHVQMQAAIQEWVDASVSKTVNIPDSYPYEDFVRVYGMAYDRGCKGCTTFRPSPVRGAILTTGTGTETGAGSVAPLSGNGNSGNGHDVPSRRAPVLPKYKRPSVLSGVTHKIEWPGLKSAVYVTVNYDGETSLPVEVFIASKNFQHVEWATALSVMISKSLKERRNPAEIAKDLSEINISQQSAWIDGKHYDSIIERIGDILLEHAPREGDDDDDDDEPPSLLSVYVHGETRTVHYASGAPMKAGDLQAGQNYALDIYPDTPRCSACGSLNLVKKEGCLVCMSCTHTTCD